MAVRVQSVRLGPEPAPSHHPSVIARTDLPIRTPYRLGGLAPPDLPPCVPPSLVTAVRGTGILTSCPSPTRCRLGLGPPHPQLISIAAEPSGIRWGGFSPPSRYSCQHSHFPALHGELPLPLHCTRNALLPREQKFTPAASVSNLSPVTLSAPEHLTSELLRTLSRMAASKPTSWLSMHSDIVCHLVRI